MQRPGVGGEDSGGKSDRTLAEGRPGWSGAKAEGKRIRNLTRYCTQSNSNSKAFSRILSMPRL